METSKEYKYNFLCGCIDKLKYTDKEKNKCKVIKSLPIMIRNNGLLNTIIYLHEKDTKIYSLINDYNNDVIKNSNSDLLKVIYKSYNNSTPEYRRYTSEIYKLTVLMSLLLSDSQKKGGDEYEKSEETMSKPEK